MSLNDNLSTAVNDGSIDEYYQSSTHHVHQQSNSNALTDIRINGFLADESRVSNRSHDAAVHITAAKKRMANKIQEFDIAFASKTETSNTKINDK
ncbi:hypothetical protein NHQ30_008366 [Ciborinia camelliae]|nr:hypothetical protein NHQ30_008366 [Ciborinia camelliae]